MTSKTAHYQDLATQAKGLLAATNDPVANAANLAALIFNTLEQVNWAGFYFFRDDRLLVGPFQGQPACVEIPLTTGVCGAAASSGKTQRIADVHTFPGHIACDVTSRSELVVPLYKGDRLIGVLDLDSPEIDRFDPVDQQGLETLAEIYLEASVFIRT